MEGECKRIYGLRAFSIRINVVVWTGENDTKTIRKRLVWTRIVFKTEQNSTVFI